MHSTAAQGKTKSKPTAGSTQGSTSATGAVPSSKLALKSPPLTTPTAKRSPSILVTDVRKNQTKAPFAGHRMEQLKKRQDKNTDRVSNLVKSMRRASNSKYSNISVSNLTSNIGDIPSSRQREPPRYVMADTFGPRTTAQKVPQYVKNLPSRTSKVTGKLVLIPENEVGTLANDMDNSKDKSTTDNIFQEVYERTKAERMTKDQREQEYPRVTAYLIAEGFNLKLTAKFLAKYHMVLPRIYDEVLYIPYSLPLLPGENGYRVQSNTSLKMQRGIQLMENFINKSEERDHHYEFYSGADNENNDNTVSSELLSLSPTNNNNDFNPSEPQFFVSSSPTESVLEKELQDGMPENRSNSTNSDLSGQEDTSTETISQPKAADGEMQLTQPLDDRTKSQVSLDNQSQSATEGEDINRSENSATKKQGNESNSGSSSESSSSSNIGSESHIKGRYSKHKNSHLPDLTKHAEMFILDYGVVVFWNFSEIHEKNILADLVFAKIQPGELDDEDDYDDDDEESDEESVDNEHDRDENEIEDDDETAVLIGNGKGRKDSSSRYLSDAEDDSNEEDDAEEEEEEEELSLIIKPLPEHDIETEEFHFEYNRDVATPRIYNDMITLKSGDHLIKLTMSHAIAQSTKLSLFESKMSNVLNSISKLPKALAITGKLQNYTTKRLLTKTGRLFQLRSEVNLLSNVLDTPEYFWSIEPGLHPLYTAVRDYLEIEQRVEVINDRCKVFLDFFDILSDSLAERKMTRITKMLIMAIGLSVIVSIFEIFIRYLIISNIKSSV